MVCDLESRVTQSPVCGRVSQKSKIREAQIDQNLVRNPEIHLPIKIFTDFQRSGSNISF